VGKLDPSVRHRKPIQLDRAAPGGRPESRGALLKPADSATPPAVFGALGPRLGRPAGVGHGFARRHRMGISRGRGASSEMIGDRLMTPLCGSCVHSVKSVPILRTGGRSLAPDLTARPLRSAGVGSCTLRTRWDAREHGSADHEFDRRRCRVWTFLLVTPLVATPGPTAARTTQKGGLEPFYGCAQESVLQRPYTLPG